MEPGVTMNESLQTFLQHRPPLVSDDVIKTAITNVIDNAANALTSQSAAGIVTSPSSSAMQSGSARVAQSPPAVGGGGDGSMTAAGHVIYPDHAAQSHYQFVSSPKAEMDAASGAVTGSPEDGGGSFDLNRRQQLQRKVGNCKVCGDEASGMYFGAMVCVPCKVGLPHPSTRAPHPSTRDVHHTAHNLNACSSVFAIHRCANVPV